LLFAYLVFYVTDLKLCVSSERLAGRNSMNFGKSVPEERLVLNWGSQSTKPACLPDLIIPDPARAGRRG